MRLLTLASICAALFACGDPAPEPTRPDVLLITLDTLRADHLGAYGAPADVSPQLDALAARGVVFERMLAASSRTVPSHASLFTSRWVRDHAVGFRNGETRLDGEPTLASLLAAAGYDTAAFVSNAILRRRAGLDAGFAVYDDELPDSETNRAVFERIAEKTTAAAMAWIERPRRGPRFLWVHYIDPHGPYNPPARYVKSVGPALPGNAWLPLVRSKLGVRGIPGYQAYGDEHDPRQYLARYAGEIRYMDASIGELIAAFEQSLRLAGGIVAVTADHGESLGEEDIWFSHGYGTSPNLAHIPFLLIADGLEPGRFSAPVHHVDVLPTLLELAGVPVPPDVAGRALGPVVRGEVTLPPERVLFVDVGDEVSAYQGDIFVRARSAASPGVGAPDGVTSWRWSRPPAWEAAPPAPELAALAESHARERAPMRFADEPSPEQQERLRALGYLEPAPPKDAPPR